MSFNHTVAPPEPLNDAALLAMFVDAGSEESLARLIQRHLPMVLGVCRRMLGNSDAEDPAQAVFVLFWQKAKQVKQHSRIAGWLHRTAHHVCRNSIRARAARIGSMSSGGWGKPSTD
jgi:DNA-directed RNA polymerase specialized sigma24 family protein